VEEEHKHTQLNEKKWDIVAGIDRIKALIYVPGKGDEVDINGFAEDVPMASVLHE
jgi:hypothetical protein